MVVSMSPISPEKIRLGGVSEVADELRVSRQQVAKLRARDDFPAPVATLSVGDVWDLDAVSRWSASGLRRRPGRPRRSARAIVLNRRFALESLIGGGGFALVYRARDLSAPGEIFVAAKVLKEVASLDEDVVARFERELRVMSALSDSHVMPVLDHGSHPRLGLWYAMPLAQGSLADELPGPRARLEDIVEVMRQVCSGLAYIHDQGVLHRDLKPENVLRTQEGTWALADFGLARAVAEISVGLTSTAEAMGTAFYTAPEQWRDASRVDERADIYSAGKVLQALVTGATPVDDDVPPGVLRPVILKAIAQNRRKRHETVAELLAAIEAAVAKPPAGWETPEEKSARLRPRLAGPRIADTDALREIVAWAEGAELDDYTEMGTLAVTLSSLSTDSIGWWWSKDPGAFTRVFEAYAERLCGSFDFGDCDALADFAQRAADVTQDGIILREAVRGLTQLGEYHNRWHVRDVAVAVLQAIRNDEEAMAALEGLRAAGPSAVEWTVGDTARRTFHPVLRAGIADIVSRQDS
jgi:serine/threonine protein kinase